VYLRQGDFPKAISALEYCRRLCHIVPGWSSLIASFLGYAYTLAGHMTEAMPLLKESIEQAAATSFMVGQALWVAHLSEGYWLAGRIKDATDLALRALQLSRDRKERGHEAWVLRLLGEIAAHSDVQAIEQADTFYRQALTLAEELGMRPLQAHCHRGLGTLYAATGQREPARHALVTAIALCRSMAMTFWLPQTEAALAQVEER
jgi:tetratricopeptide (TPR) repeat protein